MMAHGAAHLFYLSPLTPFYHSVALLSDGNHLIYCRSCSRLTVVDSIRKYFEAAGVVGVFRRCFPARLPVGPTYFWVDSYT